MSETLTAIARLVASGHYRVSDHAYDELAKDGILPSMIVNGLESARVVEDYPAAKDTFHTNRYGLSFRLGLTV